MTSFCNRLVPVVCGLLFVSSVAFAQSAPDAAAAAKPSSPPATATVPTPAAAPTAKTTPPPGVAKQGIMVWRLEKKEGVTDSEIDSISGTITAKVETLSGAKVISEADIHTVLKGEETRQQCGVDSTSCMAEIGAALGVPEAVSGDLGKVGSFWMLNLRRINVRNASVLSRCSRSVKGTIDAVIESIPGAVAELFKSGGATPTTAVPADQAQTEGSGAAQAYPMNPYKKAGYASFFTGLGLAAFGGIATWQAKVAADDNKSGHSDASGRNKAWSGLAITGYALGGAAMVTGIVLWALSPGDKSWWDAHQTTADVAPSKGGAVLSLGGRW